MIKIFRQVSLLIVVLLIGYSLYAFNLGLNTIDWNPLVNAVIMLLVVSAGWLVLRYLDK